MPVFRTLSPEVLPAVELIYETGVREGIPATDIENMDQATVSAVRQQKNQDRSLVPEWRKLFHDPYRQEEARQAFNEVSAQACHDLEPLRFRGRLAAGESAVICVLRNEAARLPLFFEHYKKLGFDRFFMVDNASDDGSRELLLAEPMADVFVTEASYHDSYFGLYWYNAIARAHCRGNWILMADADELLVYDGHDTRNIHAFAGWLERQGADRAFAPMVDLYTSGAIGSRRRSMAEIVADDAWFDARGYRLERYPAGWILIGGPRERLFNTQDRHHPHWVSKYPFFRMTDETVLFDSHFLWPWDRSYRAPDAAFLHLKILDDFIERCAVNERENEHAFDSAAYRIINERMEELPELVAVDDRSRHYEGAESLIRHGFLSAIDWEAPDGGHRLPPAEAPRAEELPRSWLATLPASCLIWDRFDEYDRRSRDSLETQLEVVRSRGLLAPGEIAVVCVLRNEVARLGLFFEHYKRLGVSRFLMVDNRSEDGSHELLLAEPQADVFVAHASFVEGNQGLFWSNGLARKYCQGRWVLNADADELLVYDGMESRGLPELARWLELQGRDRLFTMMVDVYPSRAIGAEPRAIADFLAEDCWFDSEGYTLETGPGGWLLTGGPRHRVLNAGRAVPYRHWISKYPFFRMEANKAIVNQHWIWPVDWRQRPPESAFLHLKLLDDFIERSARYEREGQHDSGSEAYRLMNERMAKMPKVEFFHPQSRRYRGPKSFIRYRIMQSIDWHG